MSSDGIKWQPIDGKDADSRMWRTHEAAELCRTEGAEIPVLFRELDETGTAYWWGTDAFTVLLRHLGI